MSDLRDKLKSRGAAVCHISKIDAWKEHIDYIFDKDDSKLFVMLLEDALEVMEAYENGEPLSQVREKMIEQGHSGIIQKFIAEEIREFGYLAQPELEYVLNGGPEPERDPDWWEYRCEGISADRDFLLCDVPYMIENYSEQAKAFVSEEKMPEWENYARVCIIDAGNGRDVEVTLSLLESLSNGVEFSDAKEMLDKHNCDIDTRDYIAIGVENFSQIEDLADYLCGDGPEPTDPRPSIDAQTPGNH